MVVYDHVRQVIFIIATFSILESEPHALSPWESSLTGSIVISVGPLSALFKAQAARLLYVSDQYDSS